MIRLFKLLKPYAGLLALSLFMVLLSNAMQLVLPALTADLVNEGIMKADLDTIRNKGLMMLAVSAFGAVVSIINSYCSSKTSSGYAMVLRREVFHKVESLSQSDIDKIGVPSLITRTTNDIRGIQDFILSGLRVLVTVPILLVGGLVMSIKMNPELTKILFIIIPIVAVVAIILYMFLSPKFALMQKKTDQLNKIVREKITGIRVIRAFNRIEHEDKRFAQANLELTDISLTINRFMAGLMPVGLFIIYGLMASLLWVASNNIAKLDAVADAERINATIGNLQAFVVYIGLVVFAISMAATIFIAIPKARISLKRINEVLDLEPIVTETDKPSLIEPEKRKGVLEFINVSYSYPGSDVPAVRNISFKCSPGEVTAVIGATGSGKTTLINLIPRLYDVTEGQILLDGVDIRELPFDELHSRLAFIPQKAFLFSGTVEDNLRFGKEDATEDEIMWALEIAQAKTFVDSLPEKTQNLISQSGTNLSGGQKQRLAIARAIIRGADICIFDDSFSALDLTTDARLRAAIKEHLSYSNIIIVAQRVSTILDADRIIVMDKGEIAGMGTHSELLESCEIYRDIVRSQHLEEEVSA
ncbi:MAG: ABC transporter ATP-binding protein [Clostridiales bacterium]|nr:ABC transporter ATP-binding protein [Clostridiales bacterium]